MAAIAVCLLWYKVFDFLSVFKGTMTFFLLFWFTLQDIASFLVLIVVAYMLFGSAVYILHMGVPLEE